MTINEDSITESPRSSSSSARRDLAIGFIIVLLMSALFAYLDVNEKWHVWANLYEYLEIDELPFLLLFSCINLAWFSFRRWQEHAREVERRTAINKRLTDIVVRGVCQ